MHKGQDQVNFVEVYIVKRILISFNCYSAYISFKKPVLGGVRIVALSLHVLMNRLNKTESAVF